MAAKIAFVGAPSTEATAQLNNYIKQYGNVEPEIADVIVALGGDGFMLRTLHKYQSLAKPVYGINCGSVGFLMNAPSTGDLPQRLKAAKKTRLHPLKMTVRLTNGEKVSGLAINEVSLLRQTYQTAKIRIHIDGVQRLDELICDGVLLSTPAGSTAYNFSAHGPIIPIGTPLLALTPISAFRPRRWRGALLPDSATVSLEVLDPQERPVSATADSFEVRDVAWVDITQVTTICHTLLYDPQHNLEERILGEQFVV